MWMGDFMKKTAIVLSGGGSCGSYQIGVWKALRKLGINYDIVTGTSVGALNGLLMVQQDFHLAYKMWSNLNYDLIFKDFIDSNDNHLDDKSIYFKYVDSFIKNGGMDTTNLENTINNIFDINKFYSSSIDFGIIVYNLSKLKAETVVKKDSDPDTIKDYIIASATCYPAFKVKKISNQKYIDGGYSDNLPINLAISLGAERVIAIDLDQVGFKKKILNNDAEIVYINPANDIGSFLFFDKSQAQKNICYGYNDTMKIFGKLSGNYFTFYNFIYKNEVHNMALYFKKYLCLHEKELTNKILKKFESNDLNEIETLEEFAQNALELLGKILKIDDTKIYFYYNYIFKIKNEFKKIPKFDKDLIVNSIKNNKIKDLIGTKYIIRYIYDSINNGENSTSLRLLFHLFPNEFFASLYLSKLLF